MTEHHPLAQKLSNMWCETKTQRGELSPSLCPAACSEPLSSPYLSTASHVLRTPLPPSPHSPLSAGKPLVCLPLHLYLLPLCYDSQFPAGERCSLWTSAPAPPYLDTTPSLCTQFHAWACFYSTGTWDHLSKPQKAIYDFKFWIQGVPERRAQSTHPSLYRYLLLSLRTQRILKRGHRSSHREALLLWMRRRTLKASRACSSTMAASVWEVALPS